MLKRLRERKEWTWFGVLPKASGPLAVAWWVLLLLRGILPAFFAIARGVLVGAVQRGDSLAGPLTFAGAVFILIEPEHIVIELMLFAFEFCFKYILFRFQFKLKNVLP